MKQPTLAEKLLWEYRLRRTRNLSPTERILQSFTATFASNLGTVRKDPLMYECGHSYKDHTNVPKNYGCVICLCLHERIYPYAT